MKYLWDTNSVIYYLQQQFPQPAEKLVDSLLADNRPSISAITEIELLCWKTDNEKDIQIVRDFISDSLVIELEKAIKLRTVEIRKAQGIKLPDAIIAATAFVYDLTLLTRNTRDFKRLSGLKTLDPFQV